MPPSEAGGRFILAAMTRAILACLLLLVACKAKDPAGLLPNIAKPGRGEVYRAQFGPGDSPPMRVRGGNYSLSIGSIDDCGQGVQASVRRFGDRVSIVEAAGGTFVSRDITGLQAGLYFVSATVGTTACPMEMTLFSDQ